MHKVTRMWKFGLNWSLNNIKSIDVFDPAISDHSLITCNLDVRKPTMEWKTIIFRKSTTLTPNVLVLTFWNRLFQKLEMSLCTRMFSPMPTVNISLIFSRNMHRCNLKHKHSVQIHLGLRLQSTSRNWNVKSWNNADQESTNHRQRHVQATKKQGGKANKWCQIALLPELNRWKQRWHASDFPGDWFAFASESCYCITHPYNSSGTR